MHSRPGIPVNFMLYRRNFVANLLKRIIWSVLLLGLAVPCSAEQKIRIAVLHFSDTHTGRMSGHLGKATEEWFVDSLVNTKKFQVLERSQIKELSKEQQFQGSREVSQATAVKAGKIAGVQVVVFGSVQFAQKQQEVHTSGRIPGLSKFLPSGSGSQKTSEGNLTVRAVNVQSGEILFSKTETLSESNFKLNIMGTGGGTNWDETVFRKIYQPAVEKVTQEMVAKIEELQEGLGSAASGEGKIVSLKKDTIFVNLGKLDGVKPGDKYEVVRAETITDPDTKEVLGRDEKQMGVIALERLSGDHLSAAKIVSGGDFAVGDIIKKK
jgi:curli biogenesis system outer membrane secretion channel CsgG